MGKFVLISFHLKIFLCYFINFVVKGILGRVYGSMHFKTCIDLGSHFYSRDMELDESPLLDM